MARIADLNGRVSARPQPPAAIADAVELYARKHGRSATMDFVPVRIARGRVAQGVWRVKFSLRANDKRMLLVREGKAPAPPTEDVWLHRPNPDRGKIIPGSYGLRELDYTPLDIEAMGPTGVVEFLEKGNTWSGRGEFSSIVDAAKQAQEHNDGLRARNRAEQKEASRHEQRSKRRWRFKIPFLPVGIDLKGKKNETAEIGGNAST